MKVIFFIEKFPLFYDLYYIVLVAFIPFWCNHNLPENPVLNQLN